MKAIIFTEAGSGFGYGHLSRCTGLKQGFEELGIETKMVVRGDVKISDEYIKSEWLDEFNSSMLDKYEIAVVDSYHAPLEFYEQVAKLVTLGVWFDDTKRLKYPKGYIIDSKKIILRKPFWNSVPNKYNSEISKIFISLGSASKVELLINLIPSIHAKFPNASLVFASQVDDLPISPNDEVIQNADEISISRTMVECDLAISAAGQTMLELSSLGIPTVGVITAQNQRKNTKKCLIGNHILGVVSISKKNWHTKTIKLLTKKKITQVISQTIDTVSDIADSVKKKLIKDSFQIDGFYIKNFTALDKKESLEVLAHRNNPNIRRWMTSEAKIGLQEHKSFMKKLKKHESSSYWTINKNGIIGVVSLIGVDFRNSYAEIGLYSVPTIKGMGDALIKILKNISSQLYINKLRATVHTKNQKALDLYVRNGFTEVCRDNKFITMELANG